MADFYVTGPLDTTLIRVFDRSVDATFELGESADSSLFADYENMRAAALRLGERLLGSHELADRVIDCLADGSGEGDVLGALSVLWDMGIVDLDEAVFDQVKGLTRPVCPLMGGIYQDPCTLFTGHDGRCRDPRGYPFVGHLPLRQADSRPSGAAF